MGFFDKILNTVKVPQVEEILKNHPQIKENTDNSFNNCENCAYRIKHTQRLASCLYWRNTKGDECLPILTGSKYKCDGFKLKTEETDEELRRQGYNI